jgi:hypothetical protein
MPNGDLIIIDDKRNAYRVLQSEWMIDANRIDNDSVGNAAVLVKRGALIADVPESTIPVGYYCFLINLGQLRTPVIAGNGQNGASGGEPLGQDGLVIHTTDDKYFILRGDQWRQSAYTGQIDKDHIVCETIDDGFVVNLPLFTQP